MNHFIILRNHVFEVWAHSHDVYGPVITVHRGMAFVWQNGRAQVMINGDTSLVTQSQLTTPNDGTLRTERVNKKAWSRFVAAEAVRLLAGIMHEDARSVDGIPWTIHKIEDRGAREAAIKALKAENTENTYCGVDLDKLAARVGRDRYW